MADSILYVDPNTGEATQHFTDGLTVSSTVLDYTGGLYTFDRGQIVNTGNLTERLTLGKQGTATIEGFGNGIFNIVSETQRGTINRTISGDSMRFASGTFDIYTPTGDQHSFDFAGITVIGAGKQLGIYETDTGGVGFSELPAIYDSNAALQADWGTNMRLASPTETVIHALSKLRLGDILKVLHDDFPDVYSAYEQEDLRNYETLAGILVNLGTISNFRLFTANLVQR